MGKVPDSHRRRGRVADDKWPDSGPTDSGVRRLASGRDDRSRNEPQGGRRPICLQILRLSTPLRAQATHMTNILEVVRAGAGSGKTTDLCDTVAKAVASGLDPARILATTFTRKAAAELKGRVQARLLEDSGHSHADRLELAAIGTVHSVAHH
ncbi:MAG: UvrD-helicase domain-containing protein, partial [Planctomyces sp.]